MPLNVNCGQNIQSVFLHDAELLDPFLGPLNKTVLPVISKIGGL